MEYYALLSVCTLVILVLAALIWRKTKAIAFLLGIAFMYFWSLYGAWFIISDTLAGEKGERYQYLFFNIVPVYLDSNYALTLILYSLFIVSVQLAVLVFTKEYKDQAPSTRPLMISHVTILVITAAAAILSFLIIRNSLAAAAEVNAAGYTYVRQETPFFTLHQLLNRVALIPLTLGFSVWISGKNAKYLAGASRWITLLGYVGMLAGMVIFCTMLGNRNELVLAFTGMALFYLANTVKPRKLIFFAVGGCAGAVLLFVKMFRDNAFTNLGQGYWPILRQGFSEIVKSNEAFAAHFSLYGSIAKDVSFTYGTSFVYLLFSAVPRAVWPDRPDDIYEHYAAGVQLLNEQGYSIHHATGWYLNFGVVGVIVGGLVLGWIWSKLFNRFFQVEKPQSFVSRVFSIVGFWCFTATLPALIRAGPEGYKTVALQGILIPVSVIAFSALRLSISSSGTLIRVRRLKRIQQPGPLAIEAPIKHVFTTPTS
jgi:hypothetical protein